MSDRSRRPCGPNRLPTSAPTPHPAETPGMAVLRRLHPPLRPRKGEARLECAMPLVGEVGKQTGSFRASQRKHTHSQGFPRSWLWKQW